MKTVFQEDHADTHRSNTQAEECLEQDLKICEKQYKLGQETNIHEKTLLNVIFTYNWINSELKKQFDPFNITVQQYNILRILRKQNAKPATINLLKERMLDKMSDASRIVERLVQKGFVDRKICRDDRRAVDISITEDGLDLLKKMDESYSAVDIIGEGVKDSDLIVINSMLEKLRT